jgi:hypothetical protein
MKSLFKGLDTETALLVSVGAAVAAGCIPCLEQIISKAAAERIENNKLKAAAIIGQFVKDQPASHMKEASDRLLGTHLRAAASICSCPMETDAVSVQDAQGSERSCNCQ